MPLIYLAHNLWTRTDPNQLPPTVLSQVASDAGYNQSLFVRMLRQNDKALHLLSCVGAVLSIEASLSLREAFSIVCILSV